MRLLTCAGGTGGGVYPALAVLQEMKNNLADISDTEKRSSSALVPKSVNMQNRVLWVGSVGGMEKELVERSGIPFKSIPAAGLHGVGWRALPGNLLHMVRGYRQAKRILDEFQPDTLFFTGGYIAAPVALAGRNIPSLLFVPDIEPGLALKMVARFANRVALSTEESRQYFPHRKGIVVTGYPTRKDLQKWDLATARRLFDLSSELPVLLVFGGSKGARSINRALLLALPELLQEMQVVHISGDLDWPEIDKAREELPTRTAYSERYKVFPYLHDEMGAAFTVADLVVSRAGASVLGEFPIFGLPAILVPYPYAWRYQQLNAQYLAQRGAAVIINDADLPVKLLTEVKKLIHDKDRLEKMSIAMHAFARLDGARAIANILKEMAISSNGERKS